MLNSRRLAGSRVALLASIPWAGSPTSSSAPLVVRSPKAPLPTMKRWLRFTDWPSEAFSLPFRRSTIPLNTPKSAPFVPLIDKGPHLGVVSREIHNPLFGQADFQRAANARHVSSQQ